MDYEELLFFAKYPFTQEAKSFIQSIGINLNELSQDDLEKAYYRVKSVIQDPKSYAKKLVSTATKEILLSELVSYPVGKIFVSISGNPLLKRTYARAESERVYETLLLSPLDDLIRMVEDLFNGEYDGQYFILPLKHVFPYITELKKYPLENGSIYLVEEVRDGMVKKRTGMVSKIVSEYVYDSIISASLDKRIFPKIFITFSEKLSMEYKPEEIEIKGPVDVNNFPPCMKRIYNQLISGEPVSHIPRFVLVTFLINIGMKEDDIVAVFKNQPNFKEARTRYYIKHAMGEVGAGKKYKPPSCEKMSSYGLCYKDETCRYKNPLTYYARRSNVSEA